MKYKQRIVAVVFLMLVVPVALRCVVGPKYFYWGIRWHLAEVDNLYGSDYFSAVRGGIEAGVYDRIPWNDEWMESYGVIQYFLNKKYIKGSHITDTVICLENRYLTLASEAESFSEVAPRMIQFNEFLSRKNIRFLYVQAPGKVCKTDPQLPRGAEDFTNRRADTLLQELNDAKVATLDLRDEFPRGGPDYYSLFYVGDLHWNTFGTLQAAQKTVAFINDRLDIKLDAEVFLPEKFSREDFSFRLAGGQRNRVGHFYTRPDSETLLLPLFPTQFTVKKEKETIAVGSFEDIWVHRNNLMDTKECYQLYRNNKYGYSVNVINEKTHSSARIFIVGDSFVWSFAPFLSLSCKECMSFGMGSRESIKEAVEAYQPDLVIFLYCPRLRKDILEADYGEGSHGR